MTAETFTVYQGDTWHELSDDERCRIKDWLIANEIDPTTIPLSEHVTVKDGTIHYWGMTIERREGNMIIPKTQRNENGERCIVVEERTTPVLTSPPGR